MKVITNTENWRMKGPLA